MDSSANAMAIIEDLDPKRTAIVVGPFLGLMSAPVVFELIKVIERDHYSLRSDLIGSIVTTLLCVAFMILINNYLTYHCHITRRDQLMKAYQQRSILHKLFSVFSNGPLSGSEAPGNDPNSSFSFLHADRSFADHDQDQHKRKIDPKYFKPKFIINELMTFWGTTCTVITWGSFYVIGGTIVATERIAQKIKAKRTTSRDSSFNMSFGGGGGGSANRGTGQSESFLNMSFRSSTNDENVAQETQNRRHAFKRISSWTKRSYTTIRKKFSRVVTASVPQLGSLTSPLNTSNMSS